MRASASKLRIKKVHDRVMEQVSSGQQPNVSQAMREMGYSETSVRAQKVTKSLTWQELMGEVDDSLIVGQVYKVLMGQDARATLQAADMLLKLKDRYPANKIKAGVLDERNNVLVD